MVGIMFAAIVAGFFSFVKLASSKENKVSEFRQDWINQLRNSTAQYISSLFYLAMLYKHYLEKDAATRDKFEMTKGIEQIYSKVNAAYNDIIFRINENEKNKYAKKINTEFLKALEKTREQFNRNEFTEVKESCVDLRNKTKPLLKLEWERVKSGEPTFRFSKYFAITILILGFIVMGINAYKIYDYTKTKTDIIKNDTTQTKNNIIIDTNNVNPNPRLGSTASTNR